MMCLQHCFSVDWLECVCSIVFFCWLTRMCLQYCVFCIFSWPDFNCLQTRSWPLEHAMVGSASLQQFGDEQDTGSVSFPDRLFLFCYVTPHLRAFWGVFFLSCLGDLYSHCLIDLRMYLWWSLCILYLFMCQVRVTVGDSGLCCYV